MKEIKEMKRRTIVGYHNLSTPLCGTTITTITKMYNNNKGKNMKD